MPDKFPNQIFLFPLVFIGSLVIGLFVYSTWGPAIPLSVHQITTSQENLFMVSGEGKVLSKPDVAEINLGFTSGGSSVTQVQSQANSIVNSVSSAVKRLGIEDKDIRTTNYNLRPDYNFSAGQQTIKGYVADVNLEVKVRDFAKINQVIDAATANGANQVGGLSFTLDDTTLAALQSEARKQAIDKAKQKAAEIAGETGITLGRIINVSEGTEPIPRPVPMMAKADSSGPTTPTQIEPGSSEITSSVTLSYETR